MRSVVGALFGLLLVPAASLAQESLAPVGARVRLTALQVSGADSGKVGEVHGTVTGWRGDTLMLRVKEGLLTGVPLVTVERLAVSRGWGPDPLGGAERGMLVGGALGLVVLFALCGEKDIDPGPEENDPNSCTLSDMGVLLLGTATLTVVGGATGLVVGTVIGAERWRQVPLGAGRGRLSVRPLRGGGVGVGMTLAF